MQELRACLAALMLVLSAGAAAAQTPGHWTTGAPMPSARAEIAVAEVGGKIYVIGAFTGERELEIYDAAADRWSRGAALPRSVHHPAAVGLGGKGNWLVENTVRHGSLAFGDGRLPGAVLVTKTE